MGEEKARDRSEQDEQKIWVLAGSKSKKMVYRPHYKTEDRHSWHQRQPELGRRRRWIIVAVVSVAPTF